MNFVICILIKMFLRVLNDEMVLACSTHGKGKVFIKILWSESIKGRDLKCTLEK